MKTLREYRIPFKGLKPGIHEYSFQMGKAFFDEFEYSSIHNGDVIAEVKLDKQSSMLVMQIALKGKVEVDCDLCASPFWQHIQSENRLIVKFGEEFEEDGDEVIILPYGEHDINIAKPLYEFVVLAVPAKNVHPDNSCDPEVLAKLNEYLKHEPVELGSSQLNEANIDPRWKKLLDLKKRNN